MADFCMPSLGADMEAGTLVAWRRKPGDVLRRGDIIAEVETDKGIIEIEVYADGVVERLLVEPGQKVPVGTRLAVLGDADAASSAPRASEPAGRAVAGALPPARAEPPPVARPAAQAPAAAASPSGASQVAAPPSARRRARELGVDLSRLAGGASVRVPDVERAAAAAHPAPGARVRISPLARKRARELGLDPSELSGTGPAFAITLRDVERAAAQRATESARAPSAARGPLDRQQALRRAIAAAMSRAKREIPHYYLSTTIDLERAMAWLSARNAERGVQERLLPGVLLLKAVALAARRLPQFNAYFEGEQLRQLPDVHLGVAIALRGGGLVAPAIHHADRQQLPELMARLQDLVARARAGTLRSSELSDGTITVTSLGERGVETVFPIIYPPQTAIVGFGRIVERPWVVSRSVVARRLVNATLAADHRVTDGHLGARFLATIDQLLQEPDQL